MVIGMIGSRRRDSLEDFHLAYNAFWTLYTEGDTLVSGGCPKGGDRFAELIALDLVQGASSPKAARLETLFSLTPDERIRQMKLSNPPIIIHYPEWQRYGRRAGFMRNTSIAWDADYLIAVVAEDRTGGTEDTIYKFLHNIKKKNINQLILV